MAVFDAAGTFVRELRAQGRGPGEFSGVSGVGFGAGDSLWVLEAFRAHLFSPSPALEFVRTIRFTQPLSGRVRADGFHASPVLVYGQGLLPPRLVDWDGTVRARFGTPDAGDDVDDAMGAFAIVSPNRAWTAQRRSYVLSLRDSAGAVQTRHERTVDWFPPNQPSPRDSYNAVRPPPMIADVSVDDRGRLWVLVRRAHPDWAPTVPAGGPPPGPVPVNRLPSAASFNALFEVVLEVLDPVTGSLLASRVLPGSYRGFVDPRHIAEVVEDEDGHIAVRIWRVALAQDDTTR